MPDESNKVIRLHGDIVNVLSRKRTLGDVAIGLLAIGHGRRKVVDWVTARVADFDGQIVWHDGAPFQLAENEIEEVFRLDDENELDDEMAARRDRESLRWLSGLMRFLDKEPKQRPQEKVQKRLLLLIIALMNEITWGKVRWPAVLGNRNLGFTYRKTITPDGIEEAWMQVPAPNNEWKAVPCRRCIIGDSPAEKLQRLAFERELEAQTDEFVKELTAEINAMSEKERGECFPS